MVMWCVVVVVRKERGIGEVGRLVCVMVEFVVECGID